MRYELILWLNHILKLIPGRTGCAIRNLVLPYRNGINVLIWDFVHIDKPSRLVIGNNVSINRGCILNAGGGIIICNNVLIGPNVIIYSQNHRYNQNALINEQGYEYKEVIIKDNVWIGAGSIILPGVTIHENSVIGAGSIVSKDIPPGHIYYADVVKPIKKD
jgi:maltose O-acetyltransferase